MRLPSFLRSQEKISPTDRIPSGMRDLVLAHGMPDFTDVALFRGKDPEAPMVEQEIELLRKHIGQKIADILASGRAITWQDVTGPLPDGMGIHTDLPKNSPTST
jgi:hypothetical protein